MTCTHTDVVGSLLRPPQLLRAREAAETGCLAGREFKIIEDRAADEAVEVQERSRYGGGHGQRDATTLLPKPDDRGGGGLRGTVRLTELAEATR